MCTISQVSDPNDEEVVAVDDVDPCDTIAVGTSSVTDQLNCTSNSTQAATPTTATASCCLDDPIEFNRRTIECFKDKHNGRLPT